MNSRSAMMFICMQCSKLMNVSVKFTVLCSYEKLPTLVSARNCVSFMKAGFSFCMLGSWNISIGEVLLLMTSFLRSPLDSHCYHHYVSSQCRYFSLDFPLSFFLFFPLWVSQWLSDYLVYFCFVQRIMTVII